MQKRNLILELTNSACIQSYMDNVLSFKSVIHTGIVIIVERKKNLQNWAVYKYGFKHLSEGEIQNTEGKGRYMCDLDEVLNVSKWNLVWLFIYTA